MLNQSTSFATGSRLAAMALLGSLGWACPANAAPTVAAAPGGLYVGYYHQDRLSNSAEPLPGAFVLTLPEDDAAFRGAMFFTFAGGRDRNAAALKGLKAGTALSGSWSGDIGGSAQSGPYQGTYDQDTGAYKGLYGNAGDKQHKTVDDGISHYIAPHGSWEMFPVEHGQPGDFYVGVANGTLSWSAMPGMARTLVYVVDLGLAQAGADNPIAYQTVLAGALTRFALRDATLVKGRDYLAVTMVSNGRAQRVAFASTRFTAP